VAEVNPTSSNRRIEGRQRGDLEIVATRWTELRRHPLSVSISAALRTPMRSLSLPMNTCTQAGRRRNRLPQPSHSEALRHPNGSFVGTVVKLEPAAQRQNGIRVKVRLK
jgi:hypothetical protein